MLALRPAPSAGSRRKDNVCHPPSHPCHFCQIVAPSLPRSCRFCRAPAKANLAMPHEFTLRRACVPHTPSKNGKNGNVDDPSQHCRPHSSILSSSSVFLRVLRLLRLLRGSSPSLPPVLQSATGSSDGAACDGAPTCRRGPNR